MKHKIFSFICMVIVLTMLLAACSPGAQEPAASSETEAEQPATEAAAQEEATEAAPVAEEKTLVGGTMVSASTDEPDTLDLQKSSFSITSRIVSKIGSTLVSKDTAGNYIPYMAESWETSPDGLIWTFHLKQTPKFHNGEPVTAADWAYTINRVKDPDFVSPVTGGLFAPITKAEAVDDYTLKLTFDAPFYPILESLTSSYAGVWSQKAIEDAGDQYGWTVAVGAGPYIFEEWVQDEKITLVRNPDFTWGPIMYEGCNPGPYNIERMEWRFVPDSATVLASLEAGELGYASVSPNDMETVEGTGMYEVVSGLDTNFRYLEFNLVNPPFNDVHVRRAFNYMINRDEVIDVVCMGQCVKILSSMSPAMIGYWPGIEEIGLDYNPEKAKEEFIAAGYSYADDGTLLNPDGTPFEADLWTDAGDTVWINWSEVMERQFAAQGVKVNIKMLEWNALADKLSSGDFQMDTMSMDWNEADVLYLMYHSTSGWWSQIGELQNQELDALLEATRTETDPAARQEAVNTALKYVTEQALIAPVMATNFFVAIDKNIEGWEFSPFTGVIFADAYFNDL